MLLKSLGFPCSAASHGTCRDPLGCIILLLALLFMSSIPGIDQLDMLCSFQIPGAWSCAWSMIIQQKIASVLACLGSSNDPGTTWNYQWVLAKQYALMAFLLFNSYCSREIFAIDCIFKIKSRAGKPPSFSSIQQWPLCEHSKNSNNWWHQTWLERTSYETQGPLSI